MVVVEQSHCRSFQRGWKLLELQILVLDDASTFNLKCGDVIPRVPNPIIFSEVGTFVFYRQDFLIHFVS